MGMDRHATAPGHGAQGLLHHVDDVEEYEWLENLAEIGRAHQPDDGTVAVATRSVCDTPWCGAFCDAAAGDIARQSRRFFVNIRLHCC